jgi:hypothetical protein
MEIKNRPVINNRKVEFNMAGNSDKKVRLTGESIRDWKTSQRTGDRQISIPFKRDELRMFMIGKPLLPESL